MERSSIGTKHGLDHCHSLFHALFASIAYTTQRVTSQSICPHNRTRMPLSPLSLFPCCLFLRCCCCLLCLSFVPLLSPTAAAPGKDLSLVSPSVQIRRRQQPSRTEGKRKRKRKNNRTDIQTGKQQQHTHTSTHGAGGVHQAGIAVWVCVLVFVCCSLCCPFPPGTRSICFPPSDITVLLLLALVACMILSQIHSSAHTHHVLTHHTHSRQAGRATHRSGQRTTQQGNPTLDCARNRMPVRERIGEERGQAETLPSHSHAPFRPPIPFLLLSRLPLVPSLPLPLRL